MRAIRPLGVLLLAVSLALWPGVAEAKGGGFLKGLFKGLGKAGKRGGSSLGRAVGRGGSRAARSAGHAAGKAAAGAGRGGRAVAEAARRAPAHVARRAGPGTGRAAAAHPIAAERLQAIVHHRGVVVRAAPIDLVAVEASAVSGLPPRSLLAMRAEVAVDAVPGPGVQAQAVIFIRRPGVAAKAAGSGTAAGKTASGAAHRRAVAHGPRRRPRLRMPSRGGLARVAQLAADAADGAVDPGDEAVTDAVASEEEVPLASQPLDGPIADAELDRQEAAAAGERATAPRAVSLLELTLAPADAQLWLDGIHVARPAGDGGPVDTVTVALTGGSHVLEVLHPGHRPVAVSLVADPDRRYRLALTLRPLPASAPAPAPPSSPALVPSPAPAAP